MNKKGDLNEIKIILLILSNLIKPAESVRLFSRINHLCILIFCIRLWMLAAIITVNLIVEVQ